jgi:hypothetical protein
MRPAPRFMWPTSELPICPSGRPTWRPSVWMSVCGHVAQSARQFGRSAWASALSAGSSRWPQPSRISRTTGLGRDWWQARATRGDFGQGSERDCSEGGKPNAHSTHPVAGHPIHGIDRHDAHARLALALGLAPRRFTIRLSRRTRTKTSTRSTAASPPSPARPTATWSTVNGSIKHRIDARVDDVGTVNGSIKAERNVHVRSLTRSTAASASAARAGRRRHRNGQRRHLRRPRRQHRRRTSPRSTVRSAWSTPTSAAASKRSTATSPSASART